MLLPKLVRDHIPALIAKSGKTPNIRIAEVPEEYGKLLQDKLREEVKEFEDATDRGMIEELADIIEVVHALAVHYDCTVEELERVRIQKRCGKGGFTARIILESVDES